MRSVVTAALFAAGVGLVGLPAPAAAAPSLELCTVELKYQDAGTTATCTYIPVRPSAVLRLWVYDGRASARVICTVGDAALSGPGPAPGEPGPKMYESWFTGAGHCTLKLFVFNATWAKATAS